MHYTGKDFASFEVEASMELLADQFTAHVPGAAMLLAASPDDTVSLAVGLLDDLGNPALGVLIEHGPIDNYAMDVQDDRLITTVRGRDQGAKFKDCSYEKIYRRPYQGAQYGIKPPPASPIDPATGKPEIEEVFGRFYAKQICEDICKHLDLTLHWGAPFDYELLSDFSAVGNALSIIRTLIEPFRQVEPLQCDLLIKGSTLHVQQRSLIPTGPVITFDAGSAASPLTSIRVQKRALVSIGKVTLYGQKDTGAGFGLFLLPSLITERETVTNYGPDKRVASIVTTETTKYKQPSLTVKQVKTTTIPGGAGTSTIVGIETTDWLWEDFRFDNNGVLNTPNCLEENTTTKGIHEADKSKTMRVTQTEFKSFGYDPNKFRKTETSIVKKLSVEQDGLGIQSFMLRNAEMEVTTYRDVGSLEHEMVIESYGPDETGKGWLINTVRRKPAAGYRIGGPGRGGAGGGGASNVPPIKLVKTFSTEKCAVNITYRNDNLTKAHLDILMKQFEDANGKVETEIDFDGVSLPWTKGAAVAITGLKDADGTLVTLPPAMVVESHVTYDEGADSPSVVVSGKALCWA